MSKNTIKIEKALKEKGFTLVQAEWSPISYAEFGAQDGGWEIDYKDKNGNFEQIWQDNINDVLEAISKL